MKETSGGLHGRLNALSTKIPPLRKRRTDILRLVNHFIVQDGEQNGGEVERTSTPAIDMLLAYCRAAIST